MGSTPGPSPKPTGSTGSDAAQDLLSTADPAMGSVTDPHPGVARTSPTSLTSVLAKGQCRYRSVGDRGQSEQIGKRSVMSAELRAW